MLLVAFGEFVSNNSFFTFLKSCWNLIDPFFGLGIYQQGLPIRPVIDFVWGTNSGLRTYPLILFLTTLQLIFSTFWPFVYFLLTLLLPFLGFFLAQKFVKKTTTSTLLAAMFYAGNVWIFDRLLTGFWQLNIAYAFLPLLITIPQLFIQAKNITLQKLLFWSGVLSIVTTIIFVGQPHFILMLIPFYLLFLAQLAYKKNWLVVKNICILIVLAIIGFICINFYSIAPSIIYPELTFTAPNQYFSLAAVTFNGTGATFINVLRMQPTPFPFVEHPWNTITYLQLLPFLLILLTTIMNRKKLWIYFVLFCLFVFLAKGLHEPFSQVSTFLYTYITFLHYFRDPSRFIAAIALYGSFILAEISFLKKFHTKKALFSFGITIILLIVINGKTILKQMPVAFAPFKLPSAYSVLQNFFDKKQNIQGQRYLSFPDNTSMQYQWYTNQYAISSKNTFFMLSPLPISSGDSNYYPDTYSSQASAYFYQRFTATGNEKVLTPLATTFLLTDTSTTATLGAQMEHTLQEHKYQILFHDNPLTLFLTKNYSPILTTQRPIFAVGNFQTIEKIHYHTTRPVILLNQSINSTLVTKENISHEDFYSDLSNPILTLVSEDLLQKYNLPILQAGWNYNRLFSNYEPYKMDPIIADGDLFTSGNAVSSQSKTGTMEIPSKLSPKSYHLLLKAQTSNSMDIILEVGRVKKSIAIPPSTDLSWIDAGTVYNNQFVNKVILQKNTPNFLIIDGFILVPENVYQSEIARMKGILSSVRTISLDNLHDQNTQTHITKQTIDTITLSQPSKYLTYRFSYGKYWQTDHPATKFISDGYAMTFIATKNIQNVSYPPNYFFHVTLIISILSTIYTAIYLVWYSRRKILMH